MIHTGENMVDGIPVTVVKRKAKNLIVRVKVDGSVSLTVPAWRATLRDGEAFLRSRWDWVLRTRQRALAQPKPERRDPMPMEIASLQTLLNELHSQWAARLGESGVSWHLRRMKTRWGVCNWRKRRVTYAAMLASKPRELVEYVVVHEFTHFAVHNHGRKFKALMDARLPDWRELRRRLNGREAGR